MQNKAIILDIDGVLLDSSKVLFEIYDLKIKRGRNVGLLL